jgi:peptidoglycan-associated lipoprotein
MKYKRTIYLLVMILVGLFALWGCPKKAEVASAPEAQKEAVTAPAPAPVAAPEVKPEAKETAAVAETGLKPVYFDFDRSFIRDDARPVLQADAEWLKANLKVNVRIEGNCDERGTIEYNLALGQRRAASVKKYLTDLGVSSGRISLISYGKEKPVCPDHDETCWQKNRRDDLVETRE